MIFSSGCTLIRDPTVTDEARGNLKAGEEQKEAAASMGKRQEHFIR